MEEKDDRLAKLEEYAREIIKEKFPRQNIICSKEVKNKYGITYTDDAHCILFLLEQLDNKPK